MTLQEENLHNISNLSERAAIKIAVKCGDLTKKSLIQICKLIFSSFKNKKPVQGKQSVKDLLKKDQSISRIPISSQDLREFQKEAKKFGVDFSIVSDKGSPSKYTIFFKSKDIEAFQHISESLLKKQAKREARDQL